MGYHYCHLLYLTRFVVFVKSAPIMSGWQQKVSTFRLLKANELIISINTVQTGITWIMGWMAGTGSDNRGRLSIERKYTRALLG